MTGFKLRGEITDVEVIASGRGIRVLAWLIRLYGKGRWRKLKGTGRVELQEEKSLSRSGVGRVDMKVKRLLG